jgi:hypothetical protein
MRCGVVWCGVVWCGVVWCDVVWCGVVWCGVVWCGVVWCGVVWCGVVWCAVVLGYVLPHLINLPAHSSTPNTPPSCAFQYATTRRRRRSVTDTNPS